MTERKDFLVTEPKMVLFDWLTQRIGLAWSADFVGLGRVVDGELVGVVGFTGFNGSSLQLHMAGEGPRWMTRKFIRETFRYAFETCDCEVVFGMVPSGNSIAYGIDLRLGFQEVVTIRGAHPDGALHILAMRKNQCRWLS